MTRWYALAQCDDEFLASAPFRFVHVVDLPADAERVWPAFSADDTLVSWSRMITGVEWTSRRPFGVGTTRIVTVAHGAGALRERFYRWDTGTRLTLAAEAASRPGFRRLTEDVALEPHVEGTRLRWTFAMDAEPWLAAPLRLSRPIARRVTGVWAAGVRDRVAVPGERPRP